MAANIAKNVATNPGSELAQWTEQFSGNDKLYSTVIHMLGNDSAGSVAARIAATFLNGETVEDIFGESVVLKWEHGMAFTVTDVTLNESTFESDDEDGVTSPVYAVVTADDGTILTCGAANVIAQLIAAKANKLLPLTLEMVETATARKGRFAKRLRAVKAEEKF